MMQEAQMNTVTDFMGKDHDRLDEIFAQFRQIKHTEPEKAKALITEFKSGLERHIIWEEEILFPLFEEKTGMVNTGPTAVMRMEHQQIKGFLGKIHTSVMNNDMQTDDLESSLLQVLTAHNQKEESILYPWIDTSVADKEKQESFERMKSVP